LRQLLSNSILSKQRDVSSGQRPAAFSDGSSENLSAAHRFSFMFERV
jgi:hypothetical protein